MEKPGQVAPLRAPFAITGTLALIMLLASLGTSITNTALPTLSEAFSASFSQVQAVVVVYLAALTVAVVLAGRLGDRYGLKPMLIAGIAVFLIALLFSSLAATLPLLIAARAIQGVGAAFMMTLSMALMRQIADGALLGRAMGLLVSMSAVGTALGPSVGGLIIATAGWRGIFWVQVPLSAIALLLTHMCLPSSAGRPRMGAPSLRSVFNRSLPSNLLINLLVAAVMMTTLVVGPFYLSLVLGLEPALVGLVMAIGPAMSIVLGVPSGQLVDAWGSRPILLIGLMLVGGGAFLLALLPEMIGSMGYVASLVVLTPGYQLAQAANNTQVLADVPQSHQGTTAGLLTLSRNVGLLAGSSVMGGIFARGVGTSDLTQADPSAIAAGMRFAFLVAAGQMIAGLGIAAHQNRTQ